MGIEYGKNYILTDKELNDFKNSILKLKLVYSRETSIAIAKLYEIGLLDEEFALKIYA